MKYIKENKDLLFKYLLVIVSNIIILILCNFYFKNLDIKDLLMLFILTISNTIIYYFKGTKKYKICLDILTNTIVGVILMFFYKDIVSYGITLFTLYFSNNIVFTRSRLSNNFWIKPLQYSLILIITIFNMFINLVIFNVVF